MAIPLGSLSGTEVLRRGTIHAQTTGLTTFKFDGTHPATAQGGNTVPTNHIIIMMSIIICEQSNSTDDISLWAIEGGTGIQIFQNVTVGAFKTFVWNERIVLVGGQSLNIATAAAGNMDVYYSYIDQSWV
tara:strand:+ start:459 stop:848 length:390 start_codon:yes stop_codon:yes gene_type:complete